METKSKNELHTEAAKPDVIFENFWGKSTDEKLYELGFVKVKDDQYGVTYQRYNSGYKYTQILSILHKSIGGGIIQSYQEELNSDDLSNMVGLTIYETELALKKAKEIGLAKKKFSIGFKKVQIFNIHLNSSTSRSSFKLSIKVPTIIRQRS